MAPTGASMAGRTRVVILGTVLLGLFLAALDGTVVGTALPRIVSDLGGNDQYTWAITAYLLTLIASGPIYGKLSDVVGRRRVLLTALTILMAGSVLAGLATEMWQLIAFRAVQGLGAGALLPMALAVVADLYPPHERGKHQGLVGAVFAASSLVGPGVGGVITDHMGWPWIFFLNVPLGAIVLGVAWRALPRGPAVGQKLAIDYRGAAALAAALVLLLVGLTNAHSAAWTEPEVGGLVALGLALAAGFAWIESRATNPIIRLELFRHRPFVIAVSATFLTSLAFFSAVVFLPRWFQVVARASATESGYYIVPLVGAVSLSAIAAGQIAARTGRIKALALIASILLAVGLLLLSRLRPESSLPELWVWMFVAGLGVGPAFAVFVLAAQNSVAATHVGSATSNVTLFQQLGGTVGLALAGTVFNAQLVGAFRSRLAALRLPDTLSSLPQMDDPDFLGALTGLGNRRDVILASLPREVRADAEPLVPMFQAAADASFSAATGQVFTVGATAALAACVVVGLLRETRHEPVVSDAHHLSLGREARMASGPARAAVPAESYAAEPREPATVLPIEAD